MVGEDFELSLGYPPGRTGERNDLAGPRSGGMNFSPAAWEQSEEQGPREPPVQARKDPGDAQLGAEDRQGPVGP